MSLRTALDVLPSDRETRLAVRETMVLFARHPGEWLSADRVSQVTEVDSGLVRRILRVLDSSFVLDSDDDSGRYRYERDPLLDLEIRRYLHRVETHSDMLRSNVEQFRRRYGER
jgi:hypothetical protein